MPDYHHDLLFGIFVPPSARDHEAIMATVELADDLGLDIASFQDHPYQATFLDTWTLLSFVGGRTQHIRLFPNVLNVPLRPPAVVARSAAALDILTGGRVELGLGAGGFLVPIAAMGGPRRTMSENVDALGEAIDVIRALWKPGRAVHIEGKYYSLSGAQPGPAPVHPIAIWLGAYKKRMLALTGSKADGWLPSMGYADPDALGAMNTAIDEAAVAAGRAAAEIRRLYNINGSVGSGAGFLEGSASEWAEQLAA